MSQRWYYRACGALAIVGALLLFMGTWLHPSQTDPNESAAAFAEYAATSRAAWVAVHLIQLAGVAAMVVAAILLARLIAGERGAGWARVTTVLGCAGLAVAAVLQAVDGVALKAMADLWVRAAPGDKASMYGATLAVRQTEIGLDALLALVLGATIVAYGLAWLTAADNGGLQGFFAIVVGVANGVAGFLMAIGGYSTPAMLVTMITGVLAIVWMVNAGVWAWRHAPSAVEPILSR